MRGDLPRTPPRLYRIARVQPLDDPLPDADRDRVARLRAHAVENVSFLARQSGGEGARFDASMFAGIDDATFVNVLANAIAFPLEEMLRVDSTFRLSLRWVSAWSV